MVRGSTSIVAPIVLTGNNSLRCFFRLPGPQQSLQATMLNIKWQNIRLSLFSHNHHLLSVLSIFCCRATHISEASGK